MMAKIYGIDPEKDITAIDVRNALTECFYEAHCSDTFLRGEEEKSRDYCDNIVRKAFEETGGDFDNPDKNSLINAVGYLKDFAKNFRDPKIIEKHASQIMKLIEKL